MENNTEQPDVKIDNQGTIWMFHPISEDAKAWVDENVQLESYQWMGPRFAVEHRYASQLVQGMMEQGLTVAEADTVAA